MKLSIVVPGIRPHLWQRLVDSARISVGPYDFEIIFVGPYEPQQDLGENVHFIKDYGSPSRCTQIGGMVAQGDLFTWASDDGYFIGNSLEQAINLSDMQDDIEHEIVMRYFEGENFRGEEQNNQPIEYWNAYYHGPLRLPGVHPDWKIAPLGMLNRLYFVWLGGFDTRMEHINMCCHDLSFRIQAQGKKLHLSPQPVLNCDFSYLSDPTSGQILAKTFNENDLPIFTEIYNKEGAANNRDVRYFDWVKSQPVWTRRFKVE